jgi:hypothetical protein
VMMMMIGAHHVRIGSNSSVGWSFCWSIQTSVVVVAAFRTAARILVGFCSRGRTTRIAVVVKTTTHGRSCPYVSLDHNMSSLLL